MGYNKTQKKVIMPNEGAVNMTEKVEVKKGPKKVFIKKEKVEKPKND